MLGSLRLFLVKNPDKKAKLIKRQIRQLIELDCDGPQGNKRLRNKLLRSCIDHKLQLLKKVNEDSYSEYEFNEKLRRGWVDPYLKFVGNFSEEDIKGKITLWQSLSYLLFGLPLRYFFKGSY